MGTPSADRGEEGSSLYGGLTVVEMSALPWQSQQKDEPGCQRLGWVHWVGWGESGQGRAGTAVTPVRSCLRPGRGSKGNGAGKAGRGWLQSVLSLCHSPAVFSTQHSAAHPRLVLALRGMSGFVPSCPASPRHHISCGTRGGARTRLLLRPILCREVKALAPLPFQLHQHLVF